MQSPLIRRESPRSQFWRLGSLPLVAILSLTLGLVVGCQSANVTTTDDQMAAAPARKAPPSLGGAELWAFNCGRCHNFQPPARYGDDEWPVVLHHMRNQANLTGEEQRKILQFLQAGN